MPVSPQDFDLWARLTGNEYPRSVHERAALAPQVHNFTRNLGRRGGVRDISPISYDQPNAVAHPNADSLIQAPVTPDNRIPKVAGTHDQSLTSQHYENEQADHAVEQSRFRRAVDIAGKTALVAGGIAGGAALARNPTVQRAAQEAAGAINTHIGDVKTRVSDFLGGMMGNVRTPGTQVVETSGDVTPPTTAQRYSQDVIPSQTRLLQATSGAPPQVDLKDAMSKGFGTGAPTIATSQNFSPQPRGPLDVASTAAGSANIYRPGKDMSLLAKPENIVWPKEQAYQGSRSNLPAYLSKSVTDVLTEDLSPAVLSARSSGLGVVAGAPVKGYAERGPISSATENWIRQTQSPADLGYTHTADPFTGEYTVRSNEPWTGEASVADRAQSFLTELQQTKTTQLPTTQNLLPPAQSLSDVTAAGPVAMPGYEKDVNFDQQTSDIGVSQSTPISNYAPVNRPSIQDHLAPYYKGSLEYGKRESGFGNKYIYQDLQKALNLSATTGDTGIVEDVLKGRALKDLFTTTYAGTSPAGTDVLENVPTSKFLLDISNLRKLPYEVGVTGTEGSIPLSAEQKAIELEEMGIAHPGLSRAGSEIKFLRGQEIEALNKKSAAGSALQAAIETKRSQLRDPRDIANFDAAPHLHPSITPYAQELSKWELEHENVVNQLEGKLVPYESLGLLPPTESTASGYQTLKMRSGGKAARTEENLANLGLMRAGSEGTRGFTFLQKDDFITKENPLGIYGAEPRQPHKALYTPELYQTAAETPTNIGFKGLGRGEISPEQIMVTASGKGYRAGTAEGVNPASIADPTIVAQQPWLKTPEGLTYVQRALTSSAEFTPHKERKAALSLLERTHELNEQAKALKAKGDLQGASDLLMQSVRLKKGVNEEIGYGRNHPNNYEVSSAGDKRFSAMYAQLPSGQTIENAYQTLKGTGKGKPALDPNFDYWGTYKGLWNEFFDANPAALTEIAEKSSGKVLTDRFANTSNNQARAIHEILVERGLRSNTLLKQDLRGTPEQGANIALQMQLERDIKAGLGPKVSLPVTDWEKVSRRQPNPLAARIDEAMAKERAYQQLKQQRAEALGQNVIVQPTLRSGEGLTQKETGASGRYAGMPTGPEMTRRSISGYETPHTPMSEPYNPHLGTRVTRFAEDVLGQTLGPGITPPPRPTGPKTYPSSPLPSQQLNIPNTQETVATPTEADTLRQQLSDYMARRAAQLPGQFRYIEPEQQLSLRFNR